MFAGKKSAQIREILISESAWEEMTCLFAPSLGVLIFVFLVLFYGIIAIHDIPYNMAKKRNHPHADAIHTAGWVSLFTLHVIWPFLWIWATLYQPERGWGMQSHITPTGKEQDPEIAALAARITQLEKRLAGEKKDDNSTFPEI